MQLLIQHSFQRSSLLIGLVLVGTTGVAVGQGYPAPVTFSIDGHGPTISVLDSFSATAITEGDLLTPSTGPGPGPNLPILSISTPPGIRLSGGGGAVPGLGLSAHAGCVGHAPGVNCPVELDALSFGLDHNLPQMLQRPGTFLFSVDPYAVGAGLTIAPDVGSEGALGQQEGAADIFGGKCQPVIAPLPNNAPPMDNVGVYDGNGQPNGAGIAYPGFGLVEPNPPSNPPDPGDNIDAFDMATDPSGGANAFPVYYSLDAAFADPINGLPLSGSANAQGFSGADVLVTASVTSFPSLFASAASLGLDLAGAGTDDLDAIALSENGTGVFEPSLDVYDWATGAAPRDMLLFSVRRGSAVIGRPDSRFGTPIEEGDILTTPLPASLGGTSPFPSIFIAAETLGLITVRSGGAALFGDELNAMDTALLAGDDCNGNCVPDSIDIKNGLLTDSNPMDGVADECQDGGGGIDCFCSAGAACNNGSADARGCGNSTGYGARLMASGSPSVINDDLELIMTPLPPNQFGIFFMGTGTVSAPFGDGLRCVGGNTFRYPIINSNLPGTSTFNSVVGHSGSNFGTPGQIVGGATWHFQGWFRDPHGPCGSAFNLTNRLSVTFQP
ncbi:MAG: hypothetical protein ACI841_004037 [Planctomycetota bacterium]|jgi:hypothetical protein